jgi:hypothetical protein
VRLPRAAAAAAALLAPLAEAGAPAFRDDFATAAATRCLRDHARAGPWYVASTGFGCVRVVDGPHGRHLRAAPLPSALPRETHAFLVTGPVLAAPLSYSLHVRTESQLRGGSPPNEWETAWVVWGYSDPRHFYYFVPRADGWELGKRDPSYPGGQRFLASGSSPSFPLRRWVEIKVTQDAAARIEVRAAGRLVVSYVDEERPYAAGKIALYGEDCEALFDDVRAAGAGG